MARAKEAWNHLLRGLEQPGGAIEHPTSSVLQMLLWPRGYGRRARVRARCKRCHCDLCSGELHAWVRDGAAIGSHRQRVDCARAGDGPAVVNCSQDVVPCRVGRVLFVSSQVMSCCDVMPCYVVPRRVLSDRIGSHPVPKGGNSSHSHNSYLLRG